MSIIIGLIGVGHMGSTLSRCLAFIVDSARLVAGAEACVAKILAFVDPIVEDDHPYEREF